MQHQSEAKNTDNGEHVIPCPACGLTLRRCELHTLTQIELKDLCNRVRLVNPIATPRAFSSSNSVPPGSEVSLPVILHGVYRDPESTTDGRNLFHHNAQNSPDLSCICVQPNNNIAAPLSTRSNASTTPPFTHSRSSSCLSTSNMATQVPAGGNGGADLSCQRFVQQLTPRGWLQHMVEKSPPLESKLSPQSSSGQR